MAKAPLHPLPVVDEPFKKVAIDIVGPLPRTKRGQKYILDFCSRYPEAIPLKRTDASTVSKALCEIFTRMGLPGEILSDQGSNFMSTLLQHVMEIVEVKMIKTNITISPTVKQNARTLPRNSEGNAQEICHREKGVGYVPPICMFRIQRCSTLSYRILTLPTAVRERCTWATVLAL